MNKQINFEYDFWGKVKAQRRTRGRKSAKEKKTGNFLFFFLADRQTLLIVYSRNPDTDAPSCMQLYLCKRLCDALKEFKAKTTDKNPDMMMRRGRFPLQQIT